VLRSAQRHYDIGVRIQRHHSGTDAPADGSSVTPDAHPARTTAPPEADCEPESVIRCVRRSVSITLAQDARLHEEVRLGRASSYSEALRAALADAERYRSDRAESARRELALTRRLARTGQQAGPRSQT
jgi:Arc/MetJ-type ribon-helix-helix transcriptional regulator